MGVIVEDGKVDLKESIIWKWKQEFAIMWEKKKYLSDLEKVAQWEWYLNEWNSNHNTRSTQKVGTTEDAIKVQLGVNDVKILAEAWKQHYSKEVSDYKKKRVDA